MPMLFVVELGNRILYVDVPLMVGSRSISIPYKGLYSDVRQTRWY